MYQKHEGTPFQIVDGYVEIDKIHTEYTNCFKLTLEDINAMYHAMFPVSKPSLSPAGPASEAESPSLIIDGEKIFFNSSGDCAIVQKLLSERDRVLTCLTDRNESIERLKRRIRELKNTIEAYKAGEETMFADLSKDDRTEQELHMCEMLVRKMRDEPVDRKISTGEWVVSTCHGVTVGGEYRAPVKKLYRFCRDNISVRVPFVKPVKKLDIPWQFIKSEYVCAAFNEYDPVRFFKDKSIHLSESCDAKVNWYGAGGYSGHLCILNIDTDGIDWKESPTVRPEGV